MCLHEEDHGILWKHLEYRNNHAEVRRSRRLVLSFVATVVNYVCLCGCCVYVQTCVADNVCMYRHVLRFVFLCFLYCAFPYSYPTMYPPTIYTPHNLASPPKVSLTSHTCPHVHPKNVVITLTTPHTKHTALWCMPHPTLNTSHTQEYAFYYYFYQDGTIGFEIKLTGELSTNMCSPGEDPSKPKYGTIVAPGVNSQLHQHMFAARLDMSVDDEEGGRGLEVVEVRGFLSGGCLKGIVVGNWCEVCCEGLV